MSSQDTGTDSGSRRDAGRQGAEAFAECAGRDLLATGETVRKRTVELLLRKVALTQLRQGGLSA